MFQLPLINWCAILQKTLTVGTEKTESGTPFSQSTFLSAVDFYLINSLRTFPDSKETAIPL
jgi:hypothetical protein